jgi:hypothetical protein
MTPMKGYFAVRRDHVPGNKINDHPSLHLVLIFAHEVGSGPAGPGASGWNGKTKASNKT